MVGSKFAKFSFTISLLFKFLTRWNDNRTVFNSFRDSAFWIAKSKNMQSIRQSRQTKIIFYIDKIRNRKFLFTTYVLFLPKSIIALIPNISQLSMYKESEETSLRHFSTRAKHWNSVIVKYNNRSHEPLTVFVPKYSWCSLMKTLTAYIYYNI